MNSKNSFLYFLLIGFLFTIQSCVKDNDFDFDKMASTNWSPDIAAPLIHSGLTIQDILAGGDTSMFSIDSTHLVTLTYKGNIYSVNGTEFLPVVDQNDYTLFNINSVDSTTLYNTNIVTKNISKTVPFIFPNGELIDSLYIKTGSLEIQINSTIPQPGILTVSFPTMYKNGVPFSTSVPFNASTGPQIIKIDSVPLNGNFLDLSTTGVPNIFTINYSARFNNSNSSISLTDKNFLVTSNFKNINFSSIFGYLGTGGINLDEDSSQITIFDNFQNGEIYFEDPKMTFTLSNEFGMPVDAHLSSFYVITADGTNIPITGSLPDPLPIGYPTQPGQVATSSFTLDKSNSNIQEVIAHAPKYFVYTLNANTNSPSVPFNFLTDTCKLKADIKIDFPIRGYASGFTISDTADFSLDRIEEIDSAVFRINIDNGFPASAHTQIYFADSNYVILDSMLYNPSILLLESAQVDQNGKVTQPTHKLSDEAFGKIKLDHLYATKKLLIVSVLNTRDSPNANIEIYDYYKLDVKIGVRTHYNFEF